MYNYNYYPEQRQAQTPNPNYTPPPARPMGYSYQPQYPQGLKGRPVSSLEEARASSIDFDGSVFLFPDMANKKIYTKQIAKIIQYKCNNNIKKNNKNKSLIFNYQALFLLSLTKGHFSLINVL